MKILLVEDSPLMSAWLMRILHSAGHTVESCATGDEAKYRLKTSLYDLVVLDLVLPDIRGEDVLQSARARGLGMPILVLSGHDTIMDRVHCLDLGADDYVVKPFHVAELEARIRALLRRNVPQRRPLLRCGELSYDSNTRIFYLNAHPLALTPREHGLLEVLLMNAATTVSKKVLAEKLFTLDEWVSVEAVEIYVHRLRKKLLNSQVSIITLRGLGYLLQAHPR